VVALTLLSACGANPRTSSTVATATTTTTTTTATSATTTATAPAPIASGPRTVRWVDLAAGQCLAELPQIDVGVVDVTVVDCATPHRAEVYLRTDMWVNTTVADVAKRECDAGFPKYTGRSLDGSPYAVTYLVDAGQDRTTDDPNAGPAPGTAICLLTDANARPLTGSARR
jgi:hypothetical protein